MSERAKHTPGPWTAADLGDGRCSVYAHGPLAYLGDAAEPGDGMANALLMAAAPDLLAACEAAEHSIAPLVEDRGVRLGDILEGLRSAIRKARGQA